MDIRTVVISMVEVYREGGMAVDPPTRKVVAAAAVRNPLAGQPVVADLSELEALGARAREEAWGLT